jgi:hypothetical protein
MEPARAEVTSRAGAWVEGSRLRHAVVSAGFKPGPIRYTVCGQLTVWQGELALRLSKDGPILRLEPQPGARDLCPRARDLQAEAEGKTADVEGEYVELADAAGTAAPGTLRVSRLKIHDR